MLQLLWKMFEKNGGINGYLFYKAYNDAMGIDESLTSVASTSISTVGNTKTEEIEANIATVASSNITQLGN